MRHNISAALLSLFFLLVVSDGLQVSLKHVDSNTNFTAFERFQRAVGRSRRRLEAMSTRPTSGTINIEGPLFSEFYEYIFELSIGTPPQPISGIMDTGSDLIWTQCKPCVVCVNQTDPLYDPSLSSTFSPVTCTDSFCSFLPTSTCSTTDQECVYFYGYGDGSNTTGVLGVETFTFGTEMVSVPSIRFGCSLITESDLFTSTGLVGFSPGRLSLISQLSEPRFSYCLDLFTTESSASTLFIGSAATINSTDVRSTPFVDVGLDYPPYYFISLTGISLGDTLLPIPSSVFQFDPSSTSSLTGTIIDSGTTLTILTQQAYSIVRQAVIDAVNLPEYTGATGGFDLCFDISTSSPSSIPDMTFHFDGADIGVPYMVDFTENNLICLMMIPTSDLFSIFGNFQQQDYLILYDLAAKQLSFSPSQCQGL